MSGSILASSTIGSIRLSRSFSNSLENVGRRLIGLYEEGQSGGFFG